MSRLLALSSAFLVIAAAAAFAAESYDGTWIVDVAAGGPPRASNEEQDCPALRFPIEIKDGKVTGTLTRVPSRNGVVVEAGSGPASAPVTGTVAPDGSVTASWLAYHASGKLAGNSGTATIDGACGPRDATLVRVPQQPEN